MAISKIRMVHKHFRLDPIKLKRAQKILKARTGSETIEPALDLTISEHGRKRLTAGANQRFVKSGIVFREVFGALEQ